MTLSALNSIIWQDSSGERTRRGTRQLLVWIAEWRQGGSLPKVKNKNNSKSHQPSLQGLKGTKSLLFLLPLFRKFTPCRTKRCHPVLTVLLRGMVERKTEKRDNDRDRHCKKHFRYCKYLLQVFQVNINQASGKSYNRFKYELSSFLASSSLETREGRLASRCQGEIQTWMQEDVSNISGDGNSPGSKH